MNNNGKTLEIVLKIAERCNLNCSYCYFFNRGEESYQDHPSVIKEDTVEQIISFILEDIVKIGIDTVNIGFHGGEPLLIKKNLFEKICILFREKLSDVVTLHFSLQTNGTLIDREWCSLIEKYEVGVGISLDGPRFYNDKNRVDHKGKGSYLNVVKGISYLREHVKNQDFGVLTVINPYYDSSIIYKHFTKDLFFRQLNFLYCDYNWDNIPDGYVNLVGEYLEKLFIEWLKDTESGSRITYFDSIIKMIKFGGNSFKYGIGPTNLEQLPLVTISSSGHICCTDELKPVMKEYIDKYSVYNISLQKFLDSDIFMTIKDAFSIVPEKCQSCEWVKICAGGPLVTRYSKKNGFRNPSVYCSTLKRVYSLISAWMVEEGVITI